MEKILAERLRVYVNYGIGSFLLTFLILCVFDEIVMFLLPVIFNFMLWTKLKNYTSSRNGLLIGLFSTFITIAIFVIQLNYKTAEEHGCIKLIPDMEVNTSYASTMILFSILLWESGIIVRKRINQKVL